MRFITSISMRSFRCFGELADSKLESLSVFAGPNNAGKSAFLLALRRLATINTQRRPVIKPRQWAAAFGGGFDVRFEANDRRAKNGPVIDLEVSADIQAFFQVRKPWGRGRRRKPEATHATWLDRIKWPAKVRVSAQGEEERIVALDQDGTPLKDQFSATGTLFLLERLPIVVVPEARNLRDAHMTETLESDSDTNEELVDGRTVGWEILAWSAEGSRRLKSLERRVGKVLDEPVRIRPRPSRAAIEVKIGSDRPRHLADLGAGIASLIIICFALTKYGGGILLLEEPELHLHPRIQRNLLRLLDRARTKGKWQILLTTHSNHILDGVTGLERVARFGVHRAADRSNLQAVDEESLRTLIELLGARAGSLGEANTVVWVEGPSDAIYLRFYLLLVAPELKEHVDYSFAFFGGSLLAHQTLSSELTDGMINLLRLHPHAFLVADRDSDDGQEVGKRYLARICDEAPKRVWVTHGREFEDYLHGAVAERIGLYSRGQRDKVAYARKAIEVMSANAEVDWTACRDLKEQLERLADRIREGIA